MDASEVLAQWSAREPRALLLDFNGTLSDDEHLLQEIFAGIVADRWGGTLTDEDYRTRLLGLSDREIAVRLAHEHGDADEGAVEEMLATRQERYLARTDGGTTVTEAARTLVRELRDAGARTGVVTGAQRVEVEHVLAASGLADAFDVVVCEEDVRAGKPDPEGYLRAAGALGVPVEACLVFEDSGVGVQAARGAGMTVVGVSGGTDPGRLHEADAVVARLGEMPGEPSRGSAGG
ncbi:HAD family hydrolase [Nocardioides coralli]|uniref:HAD family hydrolase n=1 Tax=Nocardioides coralli TaxID=2872154 RepID=UPI001CA45FFF|nr:HAD family phosphatase [Nocardioides coralli]QZY29777.1 HAD family phosphatase [Nocardioides coralli]